MPTISRRELLGSAAIVSAARAFATDKETAAGFNFPLVDYHVHLNPKFSLDDAVAISKQRGVKFGIAEHAGTKENLYPSILSSDKELEQWMARLEGKPVFKGVQAEWIDWPKCFSKDVFAQLDYVLSDAMTIPGRSGERVKMWQPGLRPGRSAGIHGALCQMERRGDRERTARHLLASHLAAGAARQKLRHPLDVRAHETDRRRAQTHGNRGRNRF